MQNKPNKAMVVRVDPHTWGVKLRIWVDDPQGVHIVTSEMSILRDELELWMRDVGRQLAEEWKLDQDRMFEA